MVKPTDFNKVPSSEVTSTLQDPVHFGRIVCEL